jgi:ActR/RegA family two-component response regulator
MLHLSARAAFVLDDDRQTTALVCQALRACGFVPHLFTNLSSFLAALEVASPEIVMLDFSLGQSDAVNVIRHLEVLKYKGKVLFFGSHDEAILIEITQIGKRHGLAMLPPLKKPSRPADFMTSLVAGENGSRAMLKKARPATEAAKTITVDIAEALRNHLSNVSIK